MLNEWDFIEWSKNLQLTDKAVQVISNIRLSPPSRRVQSRKSNVPSVYPSKKMGVTIQSESHRVELPAIISMEYDDSVLEFYDQPPQIKLRYPSPDGKMLGVLYTPDFFVIRQHAAGWEEWKTEEDLLRLAAHNPNRYFKDENGNWRCPPAEQFAEAYGLYFHVRTSSEISWIFQRNLIFLEDYLQEERYVISDSIRTHIMSLVENQPAIKLIDLINEVDRPNVDDIYRLIISQDLYIDLHSYSLAEPQYTPLYRDKITATAHSLIMKKDQEFIKTDAFTLQAGTKLNWDGNCWTILNIGLHSISMLSENNEVVDLPNNIFESLIKTGSITGVNQIEPSQADKEAEQLLISASPEQLAEATRKYQIIEPVINGLGPADCCVPQRTIRHWISKYRKSEQTYGIGYIGLLPSHNKKGNRNRKLPQQTFDLINEVIENEYETLTQKGKMIVYGSLLKKCEEEGTIAPSFKTFIQEINKRPKYDETLSRMGPRAAYQKDSFYWELELTTPRHGDRPFEIGHIDHTELDIESVCSTTGKPLGRPWATFLTDAFSRRILAIYLTYDSPSYRSCLMVIRECVKRHQRLPQTIVVDGGKEFKSMYFETLLARYKRTKKTRPAAQPRFGSVCERLFGTANTQFVHNLMGNTQIMKNVRQVTKSVNPKTHATWSLSNLFNRLCEWAYEVYDNIIHPALGQSPREEFINGFALGGNRPNSVIPYNHNFIIFTLPTTAKGTAKVLPGRGVKMNYICYWCDEMRDPEIENTQIQVRYDPFNIGVAYVYVKGIWTECISEYYSVFRNKTEKEIQLATEELRKRKRDHSKAFGITARKLAEYLSSVEAEQALLSRRLRDAEIRQVLQVIEGGKAQAEHTQRVLTTTPSSPFNNQVITANKPNLNNIKLFGEF